MTQIIAGTGHRPQNCAIGKIKAYSVQQEKIMTKIALQSLFLNEADLVLSGGALGWDMAMARAAIILKVPYHVYVPFKGQESQWTSETQEKYHAMLDHAQKVIIVSDGAYTPQAMQKRNEALVDNATMLLALWNGKAEGGTYNCIQYAKKKGRYTQNVWDSYVELSK